MARSHAPSPPAFWPSPGRCLLAAGMPAPPGSLARRRHAALFTRAAVPAPPLAAAREVTLVPSPRGADPLRRLGALRAAAPQAILRLEAWAEAPFERWCQSRVVEALRAVQPLFVHVVLNAPAPLAAEARRLLAALTDGGVPTAAEIVLRRGALESPGPVRALCLDLERAGARPYYLVDAAWLAPGERVPRQQALAIARSLRGWISGLAVPQLVEEGCDGTRVPLIPGMVERLDDAGVEVTNYEGRRLRYLNPPEQQV